MIRLGHDARGRLLVEVSMAGAARPQRQGDGDADISVLAGAGAHDVYTASDGTRLVHRAKSRGPSSAGSIPKTGKSDSDRSGTGAAPPRGDLGPRRYRPGSTKVEQRNEIYIYF